MLDRGTANLLELRLGEVGSTPLPRHPCASALAQGSCMRPLHSSSEASGTLPMFRTTSTSRRGADGDKGGVAEEDAALAAKERALDETAEQARTHHFGLSVSRFSFRAAHFAMILTLSLNLLDAPAGRRGVDTRQPSSWPLLALR